jgi:ATP-dependent Clp protease ATP-binding subunit ClpC
MFERFTDRARRAVVLAQEEARELGHDHVGTEHILLGMLRDGGGVAVSALTSLGITREAARAAVAAIVAPGPAPRARIPFTPRAKRSLELGLREALQLGYDYIGTEHILLGLIHNDKSMAARTLVGLGAEPDAIRQRVIEMMPRRPASRTTAGTQAGTPVRLGSDTETARRLDVLARRLAAVERWTGMQPDLSELDQDIAGVRRAKEAAIDAQDFKLAEELSDGETEMLIDRDMRAREWPERAPLAAEIADLRAEVTRLRSVLREQGIDPGPPAAGPTG